MIKLFQQIKRSFRLLGFSTQVLISILFCFGFSVSFAQVKSSIDSTSIKIGEQITFKVEVNTDTTNLVVFPEGQTFLPLEVIDSYDTDTLKKASKFNLVKKYGLTIFDSGAYTIPRQKIVVGDKVFFTDSIKVEVKDVIVDTTKQGLYDIKPIIEVKKIRGNWWNYLLIIFLILAIVGGLLWWFIWRKKPLTEEEEIALLPPYDRAKLALKKLDKTHYLAHQELKEYYSELTLIIRKYLNEKVYDHALESTTDELISKLKLLKDGNQIDLNPDTIKNLENILRRADLVKFAKSSPDVALAELDRNTIDSEIDHVKEVLPEPSEEEKLLDEAYRQEQEDKKRRRKIWLTAGIGMFLIIATYIGFSIVYGFGYVKDTIIGHESKELLEGEWVTSEYGLPPVVISTPKVLKRTEPPVPDEVKSQAEITMFSYGSLLEGFYVYVITTKVENLGNNKIELDQIAEQSIKMIEEQGVENMLVKNEKFTTPNGAEGLKVHGSGDFPSPFKDNKEKGKYDILLFNSGNVFQQIVVTSKDDDNYATQITERILNSVELQNPKK